jgi:glycosyltransferase involved in cell wall biosynthesis
MPVDNLKTLSLIIPVYNEVKAIQNTIENLDKLKQNLKNFEFEIIIVNDGSNDGTEKYLQQYKKKSENVFIINHRNNRGYGAALKTGINASKHNYIAITDADGTYPNNKIPEFFQIVLEKSCDMIVGARTGKEVKIPLIRKPAKWILNLIANHLTGIKIPDINSGFRIMKKNVVKRFFNILPDGFSFTTTITLAMLTNGFHVEYIPINYNARTGQSKIRPVYDTLNFLQLIIRTSMYFEPLRVFVPLRNEDFISCNFSKFHILHNFRLFLSYLIFFILWS